MAQPASRDRGDRPDGQRDPGWVRWLATGTFVLGLAAGVLLVGLLGQDPPVVAPAPGAAATSGPSGPSTDQEERTGRVEINEACLRAVNAAQDIAATVDDLGVAAAALDAAQLDEVIRRLQPLQGRLEENTAACEATGSVPTGTAPASPTAPFTAPLPD